MPSPVVPVPGVGQVGEGLQNSWGLEEVDDDMEENDISAEDQEEEAAKMELVCQKTDNRAGCKIFAVFMEGRYMVVGSQKKVLQSEFGGNNYFLYYYYYSSAGDVVEISDSEEEEVVILHPEEPAKVPKLVQFFGIDLECVHFIIYLFISYFFVVSSSSDKPSSQQKGAAKSKKKPKK